MLFLSGMLCHLYSCLSLCLVCFSFFIASNKHVQKTTGQFVYILLNPTCDFSYCPQKPAPYVMMVSVSNFSPSDKVVPIAEGMYEKYEMTEFADSAYKTIASEMTVSKDGQWLASAAGANAFLWTIDQTSGALTNMRKITGQSRGAPISLLEFIGDKPVALLQAVERNGVGSVRIHSSSCFIILSRVCSCFSVPLRFVLILLVYSPAGRFFFSPFLARCFSYLYFSFFSSFFSSAFFLSPSSRGLRDWYCCRCCLLLVLSR